ncbi:MAG: PIG-L deacetylase family protein [Granulosicoccus sp.]
MRTDKASTLILAPHVDDEVLGCFSFLNSSSHVLYGGVEERPDIPRKTRIEELELASSRLGFSWTMLDNPVNEYKTSSLIGPMEKHIDLHQPATVLIPEPSYNQDHRAFYDAALVATRPHDTHQLVPEVLIYEQPHSVIWAHTQQPAPNVFVPVNINDKLDAYQCYASQIRGHRSPETVSALAALRGAQIMVPHAEAFYARRIVRHQAT